MDVEDFDEHAAGGVPIASGAILARVERVRFAASDTTPAYTLRSRATHAIRVNALNLRCNCPAPTSPERSRPPYVWRFAIGRDYLHRECSGGTLNVQGRREERSQSHASGVANDALSPCRGCIVIGLRAARGRARDRARAASERPTSLEVAATVWPPVVRPPRGTKSSRMQAAWQSDALLPYRSCIVLELQAA